MNSDNVEALLIAGHHTKDRDSINIENVGRFFPNYFNPEIDLFEKITDEHEFQSLAESNKPAKAHRTGIYLTPVNQIENDLHFRLLRCSTNLSGPTENFSQVDAMIVGKLNETAKLIFKNHAPLNHVLAQVYNNKAATESSKQVKAKISSHADKTKDMPSNGIMAFCTFYKGLDKLKPLRDNPLDYGYKEQSGLTKLIFRLKSSVHQEDCKLAKQFTVTLYPNSVFFMSLSTNRLYTHEIKPPNLDAHQLPTRLGYVVGCSSTEAVHRNGNTFLKLNHGITKLEDATEEGMTELRQMYSKENRSDEFIDYADKFLFSMNQGDYLAPKI